MSRLFMLMSAVGLVCADRLAAADEMPAADMLRIAVFQADATPPLGSPVAYAPARSIQDPLSARGVVLLGSGTPIVLCAVDWIGIANGGHDAWREALAAAADTTPDRVAVHTLHQHDAPRCDFSAEEWMAAHGLRGERFDTEFARKTIAAAADAVRAAVPDARAVTHVGVGEGRVEKVASNRLIPGPNGKLMRRMSATRSPEAQAAPEGVIDPQLKLVSFWNDATPLVCLTYYATHPQSYYGKGDVTAEFVGLARAQRERETDGLTHIHFNGAGGNVAAGKYNDGSPENRPVLAGRMADGMRRAWEATVKRPITTADVAWRVAPVTLPLPQHMQREELKHQLADATAAPFVRLNAAAKLAYLTRVEEGKQIDLSALRLGNVYLVHMPGELFVEYQLAAQKMRPDDTVCLAAYGDYGTGYIGTEAAYSQGGYETQPSSSNTAPHVERVLMEGLRALLK